MGSPGHVAIRLQRRVRSRQESEPVMTRLFDQMLNTVSTATVSTSCPTWPPVTPRKIRKITTASGKPPSGLKMFPSQEAAMGSPGNKPDPDPMKSFEGAQQQNQPSPKTKEEAGQLAVDARYHELSGFFFGFRT